MPVWLLHAHLTLPISSALRASTRSLGFLMGYSVTINRHQNFKYCDISSTSQVQCWGTHCSPTPITRGSCSCHELTTNSVIGVSRPPVPDYGMTFHLDYGGRDLPSTPSESLSKPICLANEVLSDSCEYIGTI